MLGESAMKTKLFGKVVTLAVMLLSINTGCVSAGMAPQTSKKLGYGFEPGLISGKDYVAGQLNVGYSEGANRQDIIQAASALGGRVVREIQGSALLLQFDSDAAVEAAVPSLLERPDVVFVERNGILRIPPQPEHPPFNKKQ